MDQGERAYQPIDCGFHDVLLAHAVTRKPVDIVYLSGNGRERTVRGIIDDVFLHRSAEYLRLVGGDVIRLDKLIRVDGVAPPPTGPSHAPALDAE